MKIVQVPISEIKGAEYNPRKWSEKAIKDLTASIQEFGMVDPIIVNSAENRKNVVIGGHFRLKIAKDLKYTEVPVVYVNIPNEQKERELNVRLNKNTGEFDFDLLANLGEDLLKNVGFMSDELDRIFQLNLPNENDDVVPEVPEETTVKLGDLYHLGSHVLLCGDATKIEDVEKLMNGEKAELLFTSPPYSDMRDYSEGVNIDVDFLSKFIDVFSKHVNYQVINLGIQRKNNDIFEYWNKYIQKARDVGYKFLSWNVWEQDGAGSIGKQKAFFPIEHEWLFVFGKYFKNINRTELRDSKKIKKVSSHRNKDGSIEKNCSVGLQMEKKELGTIIYVPSEKTNIRKKHVAVFPVELAEKYTEVMTNRDDIVVDCFGGSGSTMIACEKTKRKCYMMEIDPKYISVIIKRWEDFTQQKSVKI